MAPTTTGANDGEENSPRSSAVRQTSSLGSTAPAEPGGRIDAKLWRQQQQGCRQIDYFDPGVANSAGHKRNGDDNKRQGQRNDNDDNPRR